MSRISEVNGAMHEAVILDIAEAYKLIEHIYNVVGTGFDKLDTDEVSQIYEDLKVAKHNFHGVRTVLRNMDRCRDEKS